MKIDDPRLTAYALGELSEEERRAIEQELARSPEAQAYVLETRQLAETLKSELGAELERPDVGAANILPMPYGRLLRSEGTWPSAAVAAVLVAMVAIGVITFWRSISSPSVAARPDAKSVTPAAETIVEYWPAEQSRAPASAPSGSEKPFASVSASPVSTFPMRVGSGSFADVRNSLAQGRRPAPSAVRIEQMINHFTYTYPPPASSQMATLTLNAATCPWSEGHELVRVGVRTREDAQAARCVEVRFNPSRIESYRLLGYDEAAETSDTAGDSTQPTSVTALYEVIPFAQREQRAAAARPELLTAIVRGENSSEPLAQSALAGDVPRFEDAPADFRFAAAVAEFGMLLRQSPYKGSADIQSIVAWADTAKGDDPERGNFVELLRKSQSFL
jgi:hypothetical protein